VFKYVPFVIEPEHPASLIIAAMGPEESIRGNQGPGIVEAVVDGPIGGAHRLSLPEWDHIL
jgi:hypothetical protein